MTRRAPSFSLCFLSSFLKSASSLLGNKRQQKPIATVFISRTRFWLTETAFGFPKAVGVMSQHDAPSVRARLPPDRLQNGICRIQRRRMRQQMRLLSLLLARRFLCLMWFTFTSHHVCAATSAQTSLLEIFC